MALSFDQSLKMETENPRASFDTSSCERFFGTGRSMPLSKRQHLQPRECSSPSSMSSYVYEAISDAFLYRNCRVCRVWWRSVKQGEVGNKFYAKRQTESRSRLLACSSTRSFFTLFVTHMQASDIDNPNSCPCFRNVNAEARVCTLEACKTVCFCPMASPRCMSGFPATQTRSVNWSVF